MMIIIRLLIKSSPNLDTWKAKCPIFKAIVAGFRGKVAPNNRTLGVPGTHFSGNLAGR